MDKGVSYKEMIEVWVAAIKKLDRGYILVARRTAFAK
jgi:hypothetical protein